MTDLKNNNVFSTLKSALSLSNSVNFDLTLNSSHQPCNPSYAIVGRETESSHLRNYIEQQLNKSTCIGGTIYVSGLPGTGKSAVVLQTVEWIKVRGLQCFYLNCMRTLSSRPSGLFTELLASLEALPVPEASNSAQPNPPKSSLDLSIVIDSNDNCLELGSTPKRHRGRPRKDETVLSEDYCASGRIRSSARRSRRISPSSPSPLSTSMRTPSKQNAHINSGSTSLKTPIKLATPRTPKTTPRKASNIDALAEFESHLESLAARSQHLVVVLDEVDFLASFSNSLKALRSLILLTARLPIILIAVANRLDLLDRIMVAPSADRRSLSCPSTPRRSCGPRALNVTLRVDEFEEQLPSVERLSFAPYTADQLYAILSAKLSRAGLRVAVGPSAHFDIVALRLLTKRVAAHFGDVRKAAEVALLAVEAAERAWLDSQLDENIERDADIDVSPTKRTKLGVGHGQELGRDPNAPQPRVQARDVCRVLDAALATAATASFTATVPNARPLSSSSSRPRKNLEASGVLASASAPDSERTSANTKPELLLSPTRNTSASLSQMTINGAAGRGLDENVTSAKLNVQAFSAPLPKATATSNEQNSNTAVGLLPLQQKIVLCTLLSMLDQTESKRVSSRALKSTKHQLNCTFSGATSASSKKSVDSLSTSFASLENSSKSPVTVLPFDRLLAGCKKVWSSLQLLAELAPKTAGELREACALLETSGILKLLQSRSAPLKVRLEADPRDLRQFLLERDHRDMHFNKKILHLSL